MSSLVMDHTDGGTDRAAGDRHGQSRDRREDGDDARRRELGAFLRSRRERIGPEQVGVLHSGRRRTPGLRREEVAQLASIGVTWYTWLEQGRDIRPSVQVLEALSRTLLLDRDERDHLFHLAGEAGPVAVHEPARVSPPQQRVLDHLDPFPACVQTARHDVLAYNRSFRFLIGEDWERHPEGDRNCLWLTFTDPGWRAATVDWPEATTQMVANLRATTADHPGEVSLDRLIQRLRRASPEFRGLWDSHAVRPLPEDRTKSLHHPHLGRLDFDVLSSWLAPRIGLRSIVYVPADERTRERVGQLAGPT